jgi:hypothetical protein
MDTITDILSSFFVSAEPKRKKKGTMNNIKEKAPSIKEKAPSIKEKTPSIKVKEASSEKESSSSSSSEEGKWVSDAKSDTFSHSDDAYSIAAPKSALSDEKESIAHDSDNTSVYTQTDVDETVEPMFQPKRYRMSGSDITSKHIVIHNNGSIENAQLLSDILQSLSLIKNVKGVYNKTVQILTSNENRGLFKELWLSNPHMYFDNFVVKDAIQEWKGHGKHIYIIDCDTASTKELDKLFEAEDELQLILLGTDLGMCVDMYTKVKGNKLFIHKLDKLKSLQKTFYNKGLKQICKGHMDGIDFAKFFEVINQKHFAVRYLIVKNGELRYC